MFKIFANQILKTKKINPSKFKALKFENLDELSKQFFDGGHEVDEEKIE